MKNRQIKICQPTLDKIAKAFDNRLKDLKMTKSYFSQETGITKYTCHLISSGKSMSLCTLIEALDAAGLELEVKLKQQ